MENIKARAILEIAKVDHKRRAGIDFVKALTTGINAIEKQIEKSVISEEDGLLLLCSNCMFDLMGVFDFPYEGTEQMPKYCPFCGQALKWGG